MTDFPSYRRIQQLADGSENRSSAAEIHGILAGMLCANIRLTCEQWLLVLFDKEPGSLNGANRELLRRLFEATRKELDAPDLALELLLPDEGSGLAERARALGEWCQGFLFGLGQGGGQRDWSGESYEVLQDFVEISRIEPESASGEDSEAFTEIAEFVRVAVHVIRNEAETSRPQRLH
jgi:uncharacterized protein YgfB (UPF0149 family)